MSLKMSKTQKRLMLTTFVGIFSTGLIWMILDSTGRREESEAVSTWMTWLMKVHGAFVILTGIAAGTLYFHIRTGLRAPARRNRITGLSLIALLGLLMISGWMLYYVAGEELRPWTGKIHSWLGLALLPYILLHLKGRARG